MITLNVLLGVVGVIASFWLLTLKIGVLRVLGYELLIDVVVSLGIIGVMAGSVSGGLIALLAGATISVSLSIVKKLIGFERWSWKERRWVYHAPRWPALVKWAWEKRHVLD